MLKVENKWWYDLVPKVIPREVQMIYLCDVPKTFCNGSSETIIRKINESEMLKIWKWWWNLTAEIVPTKVQMIYLCDIPKILHNVSCETIIKKINES